MNAFIVVFFNESMLPDLVALASQGAKIIFLNSESHEAVRGHFPANSTSILDCTNLSLVEKGLAEEAAMSTAARMWPEIKQLHAPEFAGLTALYQTEACLDFFKKSIALLLLKYFIAIQAARRITGQFAKISFVCPHAHLQLFELAKDEAGLSDFAFIQAGTNQVLHVIKTYLLNILIALTQFIFGLIPLLRPAKQKIHLAFRHYASSIGFAQDPPLDWPIHYKILKPRSVAIVTETIPTTPFQMEAQKRGYKVIDTNDYLRPWKARFQISKLLAKATFRYGQSRIKVGLGNRSTPLLEEVMVAFRIGIKWQNLSCEYFFENYLSYNDIDAHNILRNAVLNRLNTNTVSYLHSIHTTKSCELSTDLDRLLWSYNAATRRMHWGNFDAEEFAAAPGMLGTSFVCGPLHSTLYSDDNLKKYERTVAGVLRGRKVIAVFDSSYGWHDVLYTPKDAVIFVQGIRDALKNFSKDYLVVVKEKWLDSDLKVILGDYYQSYVESFDPEFMFRMTREMDVSSTALSYRAAISVSLAFSSTSVVSIGLCKPGIFFEPSKRFQNSYYGKNFTNTVAYDAAELERIAGFWLEMPPEKRAEFVKSTYHSTGWVGEGGDEIRAKIRRVFV